MMKKTTKAMKITTKTTKMTKAGIENNDNAQPVHRQRRERQARPRAEGAQQRPPGHACHHLLRAGGVPDQGVGHGEHSVPLQVGALERNSTDEACMPWCRGDAQFLTRGSQCGTPLSCCT